MSVEERIRILSEAILASDDEAQVLELTRELQSVIHQHIEELRAKVLEIPAVMPSKIEAAGYSWPTDSLAHIGAPIFPVFQPMIVRFSR